MRLLLGLAAIAWSVPIVLARTNATAYKIPSTNAATRPYVNGDKSVGGYSNTASVIYDNNRAQANAYVATPRQPSLSPSAHA
jgi:hypothetical protein